MQLCSLFDTYLPMLEPVQQFQSEYTRPEKLESLQSASGMCSNLLRRFPRQDEWRRIVLAILSIKLGKGGTAFW